MTSRIEQVLRGEFEEARSPPSYGVRMLWIVTVGVETKAVAEACLPTELLRRHAFNQFYEALVNCIALPEDFGE